MSKQPLNISEEAAVQMPMKTVAEDVRKAIHYLEMILERDYS